MNTTIKDIVAKIRELVSNIPEAKDIVNGPTEVKLYEIVEGDFEIDRITIGKKDEDTIVATQTRIWLVYADGNAIKLLFCYNGWNQLLQIGL